MAARIRDFDWAKTPLGPVSGWSPTLRAVLPIVLANRFPQILWWGPSYVQFYNDAYIPIPGVKHPDRALGLPGSEGWAEIWHVIGPLVERPFRGGPATWDEDILLEVDRHGFREESHFTIAYSPVPDETAEGGIGGVLGTVNEITQKVVGERRLVLLSELGARVAEAKTADDACALTAEVFATHDKDVPFVLLYVLDSTAQRARLAAYAGVEPGQDCCPAYVDFDGGHNKPWPFDEALRDGAVLVEGLSRRFADVPSGPWSDPPDSAFIMKIPSNRPGEPAGLMVAGVSARLRWDERYRDFLELTRTQVATAIANARAYEEERKRAETLAELDRAKTAFFSNVSHEFRTPLTLMLGLVEDLMSRPGAVSAAVRDDLQNVERNGLRLLRLVNSLLDFSRIEAGRVEATYEETDLAAMTEDLAAVFRSACERAGLTLTVDCGTLNRRVFVDHGMWEKIVLNLLSNAFKFTFEGGIRVSLHARGNAVELRVQDTGTGISSEEVPRVFDRFHRVAGAPGRTHEGTGIGLALTLELVKQHGGTLQVESRLGEGSTFIVSIPMGRDHLPADRVGTRGSVDLPGVGSRPFVEEALRWLPDEMSNAMTSMSSDGEAPASSGFPASATASASRAALHATHDHRPAYVLVVDDNADIRQYLNRLLATHYDVETAADGVAALEAIGRRHPDLILTDVMMPRLDGFGLLEALRRDPKTAGLPVIMLSARAGEESRSEGVEAGADDYLIKPFSARELLARVGTHLKMAQFRKQAQEALRQSSIQFKTLLDQAPIGVYLVDGNLCVREVNPMARPVFGDVPGGVVGRHFDDVIRVLWNKEKADEIVGRFRHTLLTGEPTVVPEWSERRIDRGDVEYYEWRLDRIALPDGGDGVVCYFRDISNQVRARKLIEASEQALREADRRKDEFLTILAHELRGPLATLGNSMSIIRRHEADSRLAWEAQERMDRQLRHFVRLVEDLLDMNRITHGKLRLRVERIELGTILRDAVEMGRPIGEDMKREIVLHVPDEAIYLDADPVRLAQVFGNLLSNACKYTEPGGHVWITVFPGDNEVRISVRDDGIGIPSHMLPSIFDLFVQVDASLERSRGGLGIGLTLVKRLVELHHGTVEVSSQAGSEFIVRLPIAAGAESEAVPLLSVPAVVMSESATARSVVRRALVVDDDVDSAWSMASLLEIAGHETHTVHDGIQAVAAAEHYRPDVVIMDIGLPGLSGHEAARRIRTQSWGKNMLLIAMSGWSQDEDLRKSQEAGFDAHLVKPVDLDALTELMRANPASKAM
ncbi:histidine kinase [Pararobbsia alpina]|uniref:ATP-binding protein n=1 Tax=Pararobbsia alpina TaxID=621374 RepID=UPI0039A74F82